MSIIVEDGTGLSDADSYASVDAADTYFTARGNSVWAALTVPQKEIALVNATDYIDLLWGKRMKGQRLRDDQSLRMPRVLCCDPQTPFYPPELQRATFEYAVRASAGPLAPDLQYDETGRLPTRYREKVGPIEEETYWNPAQGAQYPVTFRPYLVPDSLMSSMLSSSRAGQLIR